MPQPQQNQWRLPMPQSQNQMAGWLSKKGGVCPTWQKRWFSLEPVDDIVNGRKGGILSYSADKAGKTQKGCIEVSPPAHLSFVKKAFVLM